MRIRTALALALLASGAIIGACAGDSESPVEREAEGPRARSGNPFPSADVCATLDPEWNEAASRCRQGDTGPNPGRFISSVCCGEGPICEGAHLDGGACRNAKGQFAPAACCAAFCGDASLDTFGFCRKGNGQFASSACCADQCLLFASTGGATGGTGQCKPENCSDDEALAEAESGCFCDDSCILFGDCCGNATDVCGQSSLSNRPDRRGSDAPPGSCAPENCGIGEPVEADGCFCDDECTENDDCCADKVEVCDGNGNVPPRKLVPSGFCTADSCGEKSSNGSCFCDEQCAKTGDCCANKVNVCGGKGLSVEVTDCSPDDCEGAKVDEHGFCRTPGGQFAKNSCCATSSQCAAASAVDGQCKAGDVTVPMACCADECTLNPELVIAEGGTAACKSADGAAVAIGCCSDACLDRQIRNERAAAGRESRVNECDRLE